ncbi:MAG: hypothetical protein O2865_06355 [Planctomycetota bacterium]|nr:hypothetical protein [Planctomycetota bacterium]MDA1221482.1 hypothetical protein [Planctomycetota bacterium]
MTRDAVLVLAITLSLGGCGGLGLEVRDPVRGADGSLTLAWEPLVSAEPTSYDIRVFDEASGDCVLAQDGFQGTTLHIPSGLPAGTYRWTVRPRVRTAEGTRVGLWSGPYGAALGATGVMPLPPVQLHPLEIR